MAQVTFGRVSHRYPGTPGFSLSDVSLSIADGEFVSVLGPSGSGKSTLVRLLMGLEKPSRGDIVIGGVRVNDVPPAGRSVASITANHPLYPHLSVAENIGFALALSGIPPGVIAARMSAITGSLHLEALLRRHPRELTKAQRQSVYLARALIRPVDLLVADEALADLDADEARQARIELGMLQRQTRTTTIYVTQDQTEAMALSDRIVVLDGGSVQQVTTPLELYHNPQTLSVARFFGTPPMNTLRARITPDGAGVGGLVVPVPERLRDRARPVVIAFRAEHVHILSRGAAVEVASVTVTGVDAFVHGWIGIGLERQPIVVRCPYRTAPRPQETVAVDVLDDRHVLFFDPDSGARL